MWLEMSRSAEHGGAGWGFTECLWSPTKKRATATTPGGRWSHWETLLRVRKGDAVLHLSGPTSKQRFVGYSAADADGYETSSRPPHPGQYGFAASFYRVPLIDFVPFVQPIALAEVFKTSDQALRAYFSANKTRPRAQRRHLFFVAQAGRLQCLNGAYLSEVDDELRDILFGNLIATTGAAALPAGLARTAEQYKQVKVRQGQSEFSDNVVTNFGGRCCFPGCDVAEKALLVGSHIARWADAAELRGETSNGLCLCLLHDRAFELGIFTITINLRVALNPTRVALSPWAQQHLASFDGHPLRASAYPPSANALARHWERIGFAPVTTP